jgi:hypothetical protein
MAQRSNRKRLYSTAYVLCRTLVKCTEHDQHKINSNTKESVSRRSCKDIHAYIFVSYTLKQIPHDSVVNSIAFQAVYNMNKVRAGKSVKHRNVKGGLLRNDKVYLHNWQKCFPKYGFGWVMVGGNLSCFLYRQLTRNFYLKVLCGPKKGRL